MFSAAIAGTIADIDWLSISFGPSAFLIWHRTYSHSILAAVLLAAILRIILLTALYVRGNLAIAMVLPKEEEAPREPRDIVQLISRRALIVFVAAPLCAALLHIAMDACQSDGVEVFWPFSSRRFAADWLPPIDPWILTILIACIALPELLRLVSSEIGAKTKKPRGQTGALIGLALVLIYLGARATLHSNVIAQMGARTFHGEALRRASAFPQALSLLTWHGVAETDSALNLIDVDAGSADTFDADSSVRVFKPEASPALDAARNTSVAREFLATAQIPKASLEKTVTGYVVTLRDWRYSASGETQREVAAVIGLDLNNKVTSQELLWAPDLPH